MIKNQLEALVKGCSFTGGRAFAKLALGGVTMGSRDFRRRETKKSKKDAKKGSVVLEQPSIERVDVIRKGKKESGPEE
jgi:hypothetical protein